MALIYKICPRPLWERAEQAREFLGAAIDFEDGFIHFSTAAQLRETADKHFRGQADLLLIAVEEGMLGGSLRYEPSRGGVLFPHLYAALPLDAVAWVVPLPLAADGTHAFPDLGS
jgi:uncharacterized protein (DUF952 family)